MFTALRDWATPWGDLASVTGLGLAVVGFLVTIIGVYRSKNAAQRAREAADATKAMLIQANAIADFSAAVTIMDEIRRLQRAGAWPILPDRYASLRHKLIAIANAHSTLTSDQRLSLSQALQGIARLEKRVEMSLAAGADPPNPAKLNQVMGSHLDTLHGVLASLRTHISGGQHG